jgi:hypothetical protein
VRGEMGVVLRGAGLLVGLGGFCDLGGSGGVLGAVLPREGSTGGSSCEVSEGGECVLGSPDESLRGSELLRIFAGDRHVVQSVPSREGIRVGSL